MNARPFAAFAAATFAALAVAQPLPAPPPAAPPQYVVEVLVFANRQFDAAEERFDQTLAALADGPLATAPVFDETTFGALGPDGLPLAPTESGGAALTPPVAAPPPAVDPLQMPPADPSAAPAPDPWSLRPLPPQELTLGNEYSRLTAIAAYEPLLHAGWVQPGLPETEAPSLDLATLGALNPRGTVRVHLSRFLHITLDLTYRAPAATGVPAAGDGLGQIDVAPSFRLRTTRSARSGELHYFDHPAFGVLVRVTPLPAQSTDTGQRPAA